MAAFLFVGSSDGFVRAFRITDGGKRLQSAGRFEGGALSFFAVSEPPASGEVRIFVSAKGSVRALTFDPKKESFREISGARTSGSGTYVAAASKSGGDSIFLAHYHEDRVSHFFFDEQRGFGRETLIDPGKNPHQTRVSTESLFVPCLGSDHIAVYPLGAGSLSEELQLAEPKRVEVPGGPRHLVLHPGGRFAFVLCELSSRIECLNIDERGTIERRADLGAFTHVDRGSHWSSDLALSPELDRLFAVNRDPPELVTFSWVEGRAPEMAHRLSLTAPLRSFTMDPRGECLHMGGEDGVLHSISIEGAPKIVGRNEGLGRLRHTQIIEIG